MLGLLEACAHPAPVAPAGPFAPSSREAFAQVALATVPASRQLFRLRWRSDDGQVQYSGNGAARVAPPDSLRADVAGTLGLGRATVILTGDSVTAQPPDVVDQILPDRFALWAVLGIVRLPPGELAVDQAVDGERSLWRTTDGAGRATVFELNNGALVGVSRQVGGRLTSQLRLARGADGSVRRASLTDRERGLRLEIAITSREPSAAFPPEIWRLGP